MTGEREVGSPGNRPRFTFTLAEREAGATFLHQAMGNFGSGNAAGNLCNEAVCSLKSSLFFLMD